MPLSVFSSIHWSSWLGGIWAAYALALAVWIVLQKRPPVSTLAWILVLGLTPVVGLAVYAYFGPQRVQRQRLKRWHHRASLLSGRDWQALQALRRLHAAPPAWAVQHARLIERCCGLPMSACHGARLLGSGGAALQALLAAIEQARSHIHLEYYIFRPDETGQAVLRALTARAREGVAVRLLVDAIGSFSLYARRSRCQALQELLAAGGELALFHPARLDRFRPLVNLRTHRKLAVCDGRVGFIGGINITDEENELVTGARAWRDTHLQLEGGGARWLQYLFLQDWAYASGKPLAGDMFPAEPSQLGDLPGDLLGDVPDGPPSDSPAESPAQIPAPIPVQIVASGPDTDGLAILRAMVDAIDLARERIWLATPYFVPTEEALLALTNAALRGVQVKLMVPARSDSLLTSAAARSWFDELQRAGILIFEYLPAMLHAKTLLVDDRYAMVGSANFDNRSFRLNFEAAAVVLSEALNAELAAMFTRDLSHCRRVPANRHLSFGQRLLEAVARLFAQVL